MTTQSPKSMADTTRTITLYLATDSLSFDGGEKLAWCLEGRDAGEAYISTYIQRKCINFSLQPNIQDADYNKIVINNWYEMLLTG